MDHLAASFETLEEFEEAMKQTREELAEIDKEFGPEER